MQYTIPKGSFDILPEETSPEDSWKESRRWQYVESVIRSTARDFGFQEIRTPIFEHTQLFIRGVGESSDIVSKEMYTFSDRGERSLTLRPEGTAPAMRAVLEHRLLQQNPVQKLFYIGPMFRYERPQAGRYRQHHQFGAEAIGVSRPEQDVEMIDMLCTLYQRLGLKNLKVMINSVGDKETRAKYRQALIDYLQPNASNLSPESQHRLQTNPLRILDSKHPIDQEFLVNVPNILDFLSQESNKHFERVKELLEEIKIPYEINPRLVRGLDYYDKTVFEIVSGELGSQNSVGGGGRFDGLLSTLGGPDTPCVGFATGIERLLQVMIKQDAYFPLTPPPFVYLIPMGESAKNLCFSLLSELRHLKISTSMDFLDKKLGHNLQTAAALRAEYALILGEEEIATGKAQLKNLSQRQSFSVEWSNIIPTLVKLWDETSSAKNCL